MNWKLFNIFTFWLSAKNVYTSPIIAYWLYSQDIANRINNSRVLRFHFQHHPKTCLSSTNEERTSHTTYWGRSTKDQRSIWHASRPVVSRRSPNVFNLPQKSSITHPDERISRDPPSRAASPRVKMLLRRHQLMVWFPTPSCYLNWNIWMVTALSRRKSSFSPIQSESYHYTN